MFVIKIKGSHMMKYFFVVLATQLGFSQIEVQRPDYSNQKLRLQIVRAFPDEFETYTLTHTNGREMSLSCAHNPAYKDNKTAFIEYRNFYNRPAARFHIQPNQVCLDLAKFIEDTYYAIDHQKPLIIDLNRKEVRVDRIVYPSIDPLTDKGKVEDLLPKDILVPLE